MTIKSAELFEKMKPALESHGKDIVAKVGAIFLFEIKPTKDAQPVLYTINLKDGNGSVTAGKGDKPDATFTMLDEDFMALVAGTLNPQNAFMTGKMKIKGNMAKAMKFTPDVIPKDAKL